MKDPKFKASSFFAPNPGSLSTYLSLYFHRHWSMMSLREALILFINMTDSSYIRKYCLSKFQSNYRLASDDVELVVPSLFIDNDYKRHMSINLETGLWRCFKSGETGNFIKLYALVENCSYREAYEKFVFEDFINGRDQGSRPKIDPIDPRKIKSSLDESDNFEEIQSHPFLKKRMLEGFRFMLAKSGKYKGRLIIPFINSRNKLFYFQGRALNGELPKYLNCKDLKSSQVLYPFEYDSYEPLYITEGVFDCLSLQAVGLNATTTLSCFTSREQMLQLAQYQGPLVCAFDSDDAGMQGRAKFLDLAQWIKRDDIRTVIPPTGFKDWNEMLISDGPDELLQTASHTVRMTPLTLDWLGYDGGMFV